MDLTHVDDFYMVLERMTDPERFPAIPEWRLHSDRVLALDNAGLLEHTKQVSPRDASSSIVVFPGPV